MAGKNGDNGHGKNNWFFPISACQMTQEDRGNGNEKRVIITLDNNQQANLPLVGVRVVRKDEPDKTADQRTILGVQVNNTKCRATVRQALQAHR